MAVRMRNMALGLLVAGFMILALSSFANEWSAELGKTVSGDIMSIEGGINATMQEMYEKAKDDENTLTESNIYTGESDLSIVSAEPYKVLKSNLKTNTQVMMNATTEMSKLLKLPDWIRTLAIAAFMIVMAALFLGAIFKRDI